MHKFGVATIWAGILLSLLGLIFGGIELVAHGEAGIWIAMIPIGYALLLLGTTVTQLSRK